MDAELGFEAVVLGELGAVVEGDGLAQLWWRRLEPGVEAPGCWLGGFAWLSGEDENPGPALVGGEDGLSIDFLKSMRSASQCPGKSRPVALAGRWASEFSQLFGPAEVLPIYLTVNDSTDPITWTSHPRRVIAS